MPAKKSPKTVLNQLNRKIEAVKKRKAKVAEKAKTKRAIETKRKELARIRSSK
jgi:hypothetical protein